MSTVIKVKNLSKRYRLGLREKRADTFMGQMANLIKSPLDNFRQLRSLSKFKDDDESVFWALRDINFEVKQGEVLGIIGHNGAGKSTLLKILSRITEPTSGEVHLKGRVSALLEVGTGFHPELTGRENIFMNGTILGMTRREINTKLDEIVDFSGVEKHIDTPVKFYSSGMKVRLGFAVAAHLEPEILIIDEVLAVGDAEFQKKCLGKMEDVATQGRTVLFVSHNMSIISQLCETGILLERGKIKIIGNINQCVTGYTKSFSSIQFENNKDSIISNLTINDMKIDELIKIRNDKKIRISFEIYANNRFSSPRIHIMLKDGIDNLLVNEVKEFNSIAKTMVIGFEIERLQLRPGAYSLSIKLIDKYLESRYESPNYLINFYSKELATPYQLAALINPEVSWKY